MWMWVKYSKLDLPLTGFHGIQDSSIIWLPGIRKHLAFQWWHNAFTTVSRYPRTDHPQQPWRALTSLLPIQSNVAISLAFHASLHLWQIICWLCMYLSDKTQTQPHLFLGIPPSKRIVDVMGENTELWLFCLQPTFASLMSTLHSPALLQYLLFSRGFFFFRAERGTFFSEFWRETQVGLLKCFLSVFKSAYLQPNSRHKYPGCTHRKEGEDNGSIWVQVHPRARSPFLMTVAPLWDVHPRPHAS